MLLQTLNCLSKAPGDLWLMGSVELACTEQTFESASVSPELSLQSGEPGHSTCKLNSWNFKSVVLKVRKLSSSTAEYRA